MSKEQVSLGELLLSLDSSELQEAEQVRAAVTQQLSTDRGGAVLSLLVDYYLDSSSSQVALLLSSIREPHHKPLLEKLNESLSRPGSRVAALTLLGHLIRKQPPWVRHISRSLLLASLLRLLKTDTDVVVLITGVLVLITLLPMIPQAGKQHIYDFFDVFGRLASWSYKNPGHVPAAHLVHLHAGVYSLFHRLYGMFPCNFISYLRLHYSMKENLDTFQEVVKPMLEHVRVHPELVTGAQDYELDPTRWKCYEVHDIMIECSRISLDPLESSCEEETYSSLREPPQSPSSSSSSSSSSLRHFQLSSPLPHLNLTSETGSSSGGSVWRPLSGPLTLNTSDIQVDDVTWSPSFHCGLTTPPPEPAALGAAHPLSRTASVSSVKSPSSATVQVRSVAGGNQDGGLSSSSHPQGTLEGSSFQPIKEKDGQGKGDVINSNKEEVRSKGPSSSSSSSSSSSQHVLLTSTPTRHEAAADSALHPSPCFASPCFASPLSPTEEGGAPPPYDALFDLALPRAATLFIGKKTKEVLERAAGEQREGREGEDKEEEQNSLSPHEILDRLIVHGHDAHQGLSRRLSAASKSVDRSHFGGSAQGEELQSLRSQLLLVHSQLQYERFKRQQHAVRNRRLLRRVINATALEEHGVAMKGQLGVQDEEIRCLKRSLDEEQRRYTQLQRDAHTQTTQLQTHVQQLLSKRNDEQRDNQRLQTELQECRDRLSDLEAELQKANNKAYNAERQLTQLSLKVSSSEELQQHIFLLNQQLIVLRETNRGLIDQLEGDDAHECCEVSMLQCSVGKEYQRLKDGDVQQRQKLEAANHRIAELESQLAKKEQLILDQKKLLEDAKAQSRAELSACESLCASLRRLNQTLQTEMLHLYSQIHLEAHDRGASSGSNGNSVAFLAPPGSDLPRPSASSSVGIINGGMRALSTSPLSLNPCASSPLSLSLSPIESPLAIGSFLEQRARQLFGPTNQGQEEDQREDEVEEKDEEEEEDEEETQLEGFPLCQEAEEATLVTGSPPMEPPAHSLPASGPSAPHADLTLAVCQRRHELSIMDYDEMLPEY
ncbi:TSC complex subunit 1a isoform X2 [Brachionichthys hirsutus]|uniref:TSC complex subunit 1a isoform X2 n=1 Tax=Brachionichthys hirsutus TaxID=412623 RepID=UPI0036050231